MRIGGIHIVYQNHKHAKTTAFEFSMDNPGASRYQHTVCGINQDQKLKVV